MRVPLLDLERQNAPLKERFFLALNKVFEKQNFILGEEVAEFESEVAKYCGVKYALGVSSGTDALLMALMALNIGHGDEVITTPFSFFATAGVIHRAGARPVFCDIDPLTFNMDPNLLESIITEKTKAIIPVHLYGQCCEMEKIISIANKYRLPIIED
ncbi:MAG: aminotransferase class I/II-fold pyridoxal phosphate-dependent enzyme, partial [Oligoflexia bacterium]|nr:aminotransferase class I/II-fold pyridoxal phosphate-dependent enzyme [Oligoflexia bacterium]